MHLRKEKSMNFISFTAKFIDDDKTVLTLLSDILYKARLERVNVFKMEAWDVNCIQHIRRRFSQDQFDAITLPLENKILELKSVIKLLKETK